MRCKACNIEFDVYKRCITLEDGKQITIDEDLCKVCLAKLYAEYCNQLIQRRGGRGI